MNINITAIKTMSKVDYVLLAFCFKLWVSLYAIFLLFFECSYMSVIGCIILYFIFNHCHLPPADKVIVNEVLGINPRDHLRLISDALSSDEPVTQSVQKKSNRMFAVENWYPSIAHQAAGLDAPKNTITAIKTCFDKGCKFIHIDVVLTVDSIPILYHENVKPKWLEGAIYLENTVIQVNWDELQLASSHHSLHENETLLLEDAISLCIELDMRIIINLIHLKYINQCDMMVKAILELFEKYPTLFKRAIICSFNPVMLYLIRKKNPGIIVALCWQPSIYFLQSFNCTISWLNKVDYYGSVKKLTLQILDFTVLWFISNIIYRILGVSSVILHKDVITPDIVNQWENKGVRVIASVVNLRVEKAYYSQAIGISYLTDTIDN